jgi:KDO2-lipid IV(A) lauroyltransferase
MARKAGRRRLRYWIEAAAVSLAVALFGALPLDRASALGGWLGRALGPRLRRTRVAERNLRRAFPERSPAEIAAIVGAMWDNLGRVAAEFPHLGEFDVYADDGRVEAVGTEHLDALIAAGGNAIFFSAHLGNWEIAPLCT